MKCLTCGIPFSPDDILVMEDHELPVCDVCDAKEYHILVNYDVNEDFYEFLGKQVSKKICNVCIRGQYELVSIKYGNPVKASVICPTCKAKDKMSIYIKFV
ncbi:hypothetical protein [Paenisporosarcina sp. OV554]|uniref:hypothetical protein n=1 Tax=Paenisporosarcina sp. OV554 TaxID=2135694 RepID=UPI000D3876B4|nr:hypothetical protein [Paenisporosarcina sp. OV554]PUB12642.1 hypothetical protein C8K15_109141 [Paenisporosarcina sp. OV554]